MAGYFADSARPFLVCFGEWRLGLAMGASPRAPNAERAPASQRECHPSALGLKYRGGTLATPNRARVVTGELTPDT